ncbi:hypothetical protein ABIE78_006374 [Sinorhizobium fredii]|uniref:Uncharacterized protein n=1 Tax=Sinorhizobium fredii (strain USDA 257) TaxID=1185652 RepID=I3XDP1_SINF2|nr:DUF6074 family protein [Sinorhizobium fredii]AFL53997.1 hypothetical protein USDA257_c54820 [Sinorhizobium fredii USDA 257]
MRDRDLPLFAWQPPCKLIAFPMANRVGKIRDVARKLAEKTTERHAGYYAKQVTDGLTAHFDRLGIPPHERDQQIDAFWTKVEQEVLRLTYQSSGAGSHDPRGAA